MDTENTKFLKFKDISDANNKLLKIENSSNINSSAEDNVSSNTKDNTNSNTKDNIKNNNQKTKNNIDNLVVFKGKRNGIALNIDKTADFEDIKKSLTNKVIEAKTFFKGYKTSITFRGRKLTEDEEDELIEIIKTNTTMNIKFVKSEYGDESDKKLLNKIDNLFGEEGIQIENFCKFHYGALRSGQVLQFDGTVVIIGDVNPGSLIRANGNIVVLGQLRGVAHAGFSGNKNAFIAASHMVPSQLRIANIITRFPDENISSEKKPEYAYIEDNQIYVIPLG